MTLLLTPLNHCVASLLLHRQKRAWVIEVARLSLGALIEARSVHDDLPVGSQGYVGAVHGSWCGTFEVHAFAIIAAAVAGTLEFVFASFPVRSAAEVRAARVDNKDPV